MGATWLPILESVPLFEGLSRRHLRGVEALARTKRYRPGTAVVREGEPGESFRVVLEGGGRDRDQ
jgi:CRP-like cAMP-binding protein